MSLSRILKRGILAAALGAVAVAATPASAEVTLRVVPHSNLAILDPIWTTAYMSRNHGYMIYDTLFGTDENAQDQAADGRELDREPGPRLWTFKLRKGLEFHDGKPVTGEDVIAVVQRWGKRDAMGTALMQFVSAWTRPRPTPSASSCARPAASCSRRWASRRRTCPSSCPSASPRPTPSSRSRTTSARAPTSSSATSSSPATRRSTSRTPSTCRAASRRRAPPAASASTSTASSGTSRCATRRRRSTRCRRARSTSSRRSASTSTRPPRRIRTCSCPRYSKLGLQYMARFNHLLHALRQPEGAPGGARGVLPGALPARAGRRQGTLQALRVDVHLRHALRQRGRQRHPVQVRTCARRRSC